MLCMPALLADDAISNDLASYSNQITNVFCIDGQSRCIIRLDCTQSNPIVVYAPKTFQESQDDSIHRLVLPNTTISSDQSCACLKQKGKHAQLLIVGEMLLKSVGKNQLVFIVEKN